MKKVSLLSIVTLLLINFSAFAGKKSQTKKNPLDQILDVAEKRSTKSGQYIAEAESIIAFGEKLYGILERGEPTFALNNGNTLSALEKNYLVSISHPMEQGRLSSYKIEDSFDSYSTSYKLIYNLKEYYVRLVFQIREKRWSNFSLNLFAISL